jgi:very-short-patch-repair endonuclease
VKSSTTRQARGLRQRSTEAERRLWSRLRGRQVAGAKFRRQQPLGRYVVDFVSLEHRLVVEVDGGQHAGRRTDSARERELGRLGFRVVRFWNHEVLAETDAVLEKIRESLTTPHPASPARGEERKATRVSAGVPATGARDGRPVLGTWNFVRLEAM